MLSLSPLTVLPCSPLEQIDAAHAAGFDAVGLRLIPTLPGDPDIMSDGPLRRDLVAHLRRTRLQVLDVEVVRITPDLRLEALEPVLQFAADLGARLLTVTGDFSPAWRGQYGAACYSSLLAMCEACASVDITAMLEFMPYRNVPTLHEAARIREAIGHSSLAICFDALHFHRSGGVVSDLAAITPQALGCFQICDAPAEPPNDLATEALYGRLMPGDGAIPLLDLLRAMPPDVPVSVEAPLRNESLSVRDKAKVAAQSMRKLFTAAGR